MNNKTLKMKNRNSFFHYFSFPARAGDLYGMFASIQLIKKHKRLASAGKTLKEMEFSFYQAVSSKGLAIFALHYKEYEQQSSGNFVISLASTVNSLVKYAKLWWYKCNSFEDI